MPVSESSAMRQLRRRSAQKPQLDCLSRLLQLRSRIGQTILGIAARALNSLARICGPKRARIKESSCHAARAKRSLAWRNSSQAAKTFLHDHTYGPNLPLDRVRTHGLYDLAPERGVQLLSRWACTDNYDFHC